MSAFDSIGEFEHMVLLSVLRLGDEAYAVTVRDEILAHTGRDVSRGSIYITLDRLETKGFLKSRLGEPTAERGGRAKRYYTLRPVAIEALKEIDVRLRYSQNKLSAHRVACRFLSSAGSEVARSNLLTAVLPRAGFVVLRRL